MMCVVSAYIGRLRDAGAALVVGMFAAVPSLAHAAEGPLADPKVWCGSAAKMIADKDTDGFIDSFVFASDRLVDRPSVEQAFAALAPALAREGEALSHSFLTRKDYGEAFSRVWYLVQFEKGLIFLRCEGAKRGAAWFIFSVTYDSASNAVNLP
jgi:hypothetical protein